MIKNISFALLVLSLTTLLTSCGGTPEAINLAQCLTDKGVKMYGTYWCKVCQAQKKLFGEEAFGKISYVECDPAGGNPKPALCLEKKIERYPTWEFAGGEKVARLFQLEELAEKTGCQYVTPTK